MNVNSYLYSDFGDSEFCLKRIDPFNFNVKKAITLLTRKEPIGNGAAKCISPFVGLGAFIVSVAIRIGAIVEPILGILVDLIAVLIFRSSAPLYHVPWRIVRLANNLFGSTFGIIRDVVMLVFVAGVGGTINPEEAYAQLSKDAVK